MTITWRDTYKQPQADVSGLIQGGALAAKGIQGFGTALQGFDDSNRMAELARFTDAQRLNEALSRGQFDGASQDFLKQAMSRPADLLSDAATQQKFDQNTLMNPLLVNQQQLVNASNQQKYDHAGQINPLLVNEAKRINESDAARQPGVLAGITQADALRAVQDPVALSRAGYQASADNLTNPQIPINAQRALDTGERNYVAGEDTRLAGEDFGVRDAANQFQTVGQGLAFLRSLPANTPQAIRNTYQQRLEAKFGAGTMGGFVSGSAGTAISGALTAPATGNAAVGVAGSTPAASVIGGTVASIPKEISTQFSTQETALGLPTGVMQSLVMQETSGKEAYFKDPAKYHYEADANGKRKSSAFGPYGILESTAKDPGYGIKPLAADKNITDQTRFATEYLAARIKAAGGDVRKGLAGYGEGIEYADEVIGRIANTDPSTAQSAVVQAPAPTTTSSNLAVRALQQQVAAGAVAAQNNSPFKTSIAQSLTQPSVDEAALLGSLQIDPAFKGVAPSVIVSAIDFVKANTKLQNNNAIGNVLRNSMSGDTEFNWTSGEGLRSRSFDKDKLKNLGNEAASVKTSILDSVEKSAASGQELALLDQYVGQASQAEQALIAMETRKATIGDVTPATEREVRNSYANAIDKANKHSLKINSIEELRSSDSEAKKKALIAKELAQAAARKSKEAAQAEQQAKKLATDEAAFAKASPEHQKHILANRAQEKQAADNRAASILQKQQAKQKELDKVSWLTPEVAQVMTRKEAYDILNDTEIVDLVDPRAAYYLRKRAQIKDGT